MEYTEEDKRLWHMLTTDPEITAKYLAHLQAKESMRRIDDKKITEAEYKCEGDR